MDELIKAKILIVDDNEELQKLVKTILIQDGFLDIFSAGSCSMAKTYFETLKPDFVILDICLPDGDGFSLMQYFRSISQTPVLFLSARDEDKDRLYGLGLGADDYLTKPFLPQELILRIRSILRRTYLLTNPSSEQSHVLTLGNKEINFDSGTITENGQSQELTAKELMLLQKLYENRGNIVTFDSICNTLWGDPSYYGYENSLMVHIRRLREKIEENPSKPKYILTVRGLGYKMTKGIV